MKKLIDKDGYKLCPICGGKIESCANPHFHVIDGEIKHSLKEWEKAAKLEIL